MFDKINKRIRFKLSKFLRSDKNKKVEQVRVNGYQLLILVNEDVGRQIRYLGQFEIHETKYYEKIIKDDDICVDIGANIGYFTLLMARKAGRGHVHAFDPLALNVALINASVKLNHLSNVSVNELAVSNTNGDVQFIQSCDGAYSSMIDTGRKSVGNTLSVQATTLDAHIEKNSIERVDILKADVEGAEALVIDGATKLLLDKRRRPRSLLLELFDDNLRVYKTDINTVIGKLGSLGYSPFVLDTQGDLIPYAAKLKVTDCNIIFQAD